jgi:hypothetical protein
VVSSTAASSAALLQATKATMARALRKKAYFFHFDWGFLG